MRCALARRLRPRGTWRGSPLRGLWYPRTTEVALPIRTALVLALLAAPIRQEEKPPIFETGVEIVALDVTVVDAEGRPVADLRADEFRLALDGRPRKVLSAEFVAQTGELPEPTQGAGLHFTTNEGLVPGRLVVLTVDQGNIPLGHGREVLDAAGRLFDRLGPADRVGLLTLPGPEPREEFTADHGRVREALRRVIGLGRLGGRRVSVTEALAYQEQEDLERWRAAVVRECSPGDDACIMELETEASTVAWNYRQQSERSLAVLRSAFETLGRIEGPKVMVLVTAGLGLPDAGPRGRPVWALRELATEAARSRVSLYVVRVDRSGMPTADQDLPLEALDQDRFLHAEGIESFAALARGAVFRGSPDRAFARIVREMSGYYLLGFEPDRRERDGRAHDIQVEVTRPGLTVRARRVAAIPSPASPKEEEASLAASLRAPIPATAIPVRVATWALKDAAGEKVRVLLRAEIGTTPPPELAVAWVLLDGRGRVAGSAVQRMTSGREAQAPVRYVTTVTVPSGLYTLKLAARDRSGRQGGVEHPVKAALTGMQGLEASDLLLGPPPAQGASFQPAVDLVLDGDVLLAHMELYGPEADATVTVEVARDESGPALREAPARLSRTPVAGRRVVQALIPLADLPAGAYLVRATVALGGHPVGRMSHPFRIGARRQGA